MKKEHIYLSIAVAAIIMYFHSKKGTKTKTISGLNVKVNPSRLLDGTMAYMGVNPMFHGPIKSVANKVLGKIIA